MKKENAIGVFDSGVGGLTVLKEIQKLLPFEDVIYLGDTARVPYGTKSASTVVKYTERNAEFLIQQKVKAIVIACNTASAYGLESLKQKVDLPLLGVIEPGAKKVIQVTRNKNVGVIGTAGTIASKAYEKAIYALDSSLKIQSQACSLLVALAEEGWVTGDVVKQVLEKYLQKFKECEKPIDTLVLGCTHYPLFRQSLKEYFGDEVTLVDSAVETALALKNELTRLNLLSESKKGKAHFYSTDEPHSMQQIASNFLGYKPDQIEKIEIIF